MMNLRIEPIVADVKDWQNFPHDKNQIVIWWLGQAGFLFRYQEYSLIIDPYLSNSIAEKRKADKISRNRMIPIPIETCNLNNINWIFSTHSHSDHMDIGTLPKLVEINPNCKYFAPAACKNIVLNELKINPLAVQFVNSGEKIKLVPEIELDIVAAAHEELKFDANGNSDFIGFIFSFNGVKIYHSGDCVPYEGLIELIKNCNIDLALLPVNGRDEARLKANILGNFHFEEAVELCKQTQIKYLIPHHFGLFAYNTVDPELLKKKIDTVKNDLKIILPEIGKAFVINISK